MSKHFFDYDDGDFGYSISDDMAINSNGDLMIKIDDNMALDLDSGDLHFISSWPETENIFEEENEEE